MTQTTDNAQAETLAEQLDVIRADIARLAAMIADRASEKAGEARQTAHSVSEEARARADAYRAEAGRQDSHAYETGQEAVRKNPVLAVGIALGAGVLLGRSVLRRF
ncbi:MAG: hypothetical protein AAFU86_13305 [Pseudomonadota bacterium]